jgi:hypothetical protein
MEAENRAIFRALFSEQTNKWIKVERQKRRSMQPDSKALPRPPHARCAARHMHSLLSSSSLSNQTVSVRSCTIVQDRARKALPARGALPSQKPTALR